ncbi:MAG: cytochrome c3 family protein [Bdellovibrionota bacterium]
MNTYYKLFLVLLSLMVFHDLSHAGMKNSKHDFSKEAWSNGKICEVCHSKIFFNLEASEDSGSGAQGEARETITRLCLQCHDDHKPGEPMLTHPPSIATPTPKALVNFKSMEKGGLGGSIVIGINDQSQNDYRRCAQCHDVHKTANDHLLNDNYGVKNEN